MGTGEQVGYMLMGSQPPSARIRWTCVLVKRTGELKPEKKSGAKGSRTPDLLNAIQALYQLSYGPEWELHKLFFFRFPKIWCS